jgi:fatty-acyl-CoA synthase
MLETVREVAPRCPELREIICFDDWRLHRRRRRQEHRLPRSNRPIRDDPVYPGTTGFPKARCCIIAVSPTTRRHCRSNGDRPGDVFITTMPLFHTGGCVCCVLGSVSKAATQVLLEAFEPGLVLELPRYRGNAMVGVPTMLVAMLEHPLWIDRSFIGQGDLFGGSTVPAALVTLFEQSWAPSPSCSGRRNARRWRP